MEGRRRVPLLPAGAVAPEKDKWGNWVINKELQRRHAGRGGLQAGRVRYAPSDAIYWQHGHSTERDFIYVTTAHLSHDQLQQLSDEVGRTGRSSCSAPPSAPSRTTSRT